MFLYTINDTPGPYSSLNKAQAWALLFLLFGPLAWAGKPVIHINIEQHLFEPSEITIPANTKVKLRVHNLDASPEEFESWELNREKVIMGNSTATIFIGPLSPGIYPFFGEFNPKTAQGKVIVE